MKTRKEQILSYYDYENYDAVDEAKHADEMEDAAVIAQEQEKKYKKICADLIRRSRANEKRMSKVENRLAYMFAQVISAIHSLEIKDLAGACEYLNAIERNCKEEVKNLYADENVKF